MCDRTLEACGERGEARTTYDQLKKAARADGFRPIPQSKHAKLVVEIRIDDMGTRTDLADRHALEDFLDALVGWLGLGHLDGGSSGSGSMEAMCYVVDFRVAKSAIEEALLASPFANYSRVYREK